LNSFAEIRQSAKELNKGQPFDLVLHNAGIILASPRRSVTIDGLEECLQCHAAGPMLLTAMLAPELPRPSRIIAVSSGLHKPNTYYRDGAFDFSDPNLEKNYNRTRAYKNAKLAQLWFILEWERRFGSAGIHADAVCPGFVPTTAARQASGVQHFLLARVLPLMPFAVTLEQAAQILADWCLGELDAPGARYFDGRRLARPSDEALNAQKAHAFWQKVENWIGHKIDL